MSNKIVPNAHFYAAISDHVYNQENRNHEIDLTSLAAFEFSELRSPFDDSATQGNDSPPSGFHAQTYRIDGKIVVAFRGTDFADDFDKDFSRGNLPLAVGDVRAAQWQDAITYVNNVIEARGVSGEDLVFTGHSLGGGLAALAGAYYGGEAHGFAPAPFLMTAESHGFVPNNFDPDIRQNIMQAVENGPPVRPVEPPIRMTVAYREYLQELAQYEIDLAAYEAILELRHQKVNENLEGLTSYVINDEVLQKYVPSVTGALPIAGAELIFAGVNFAMFYGYIRDLVNPFTDDPDVPILFPSDVNRPLHFDIDSHGNNTPEIILDIGPSVTSLIGGALDAVARHSIALHALAARTDIRVNSADSAATSQPFGGENGLLTLDGQLRGSLLNFAGISGPISHINMEAGNNPVEAPNPPAIYRALYNSLGESGDLRIYDYFYQFFSKVREGAAADGLTVENIDLETELSIHSGIVKISLGILRDAVQDSTDVASVRDAIEARTGFKNSAFGGADVEGNILEDYIILDLNGLLDSLSASGLGNAEELRKTQLDGETQHHGIRDINDHIFTEILESFRNPASGLNLGAIQVGQYLTGNVLGSDFLDTEYWESYEDTNSFGRERWEILVSQAGNDDGRLDYAPDTTPRGGESQTPADDERAHVIVGGAGKNVLTGSLSDDIIIGGDGTALSGAEGFANAFTWTGGDDIYVGGKGKDRYIFTGTHQFAPAASVSSQEFVHGNLFFGGAEKDIVDYSQYENSKKHGYEIQLKELENFSLLNPIYVKFRHEGQATVEPQRIRDELFLVEEVIGTEFEDTIEFESLNILDNFEGLLFDGGNATAADGTEGFDILDFSNLEGGDAGIDSKIFDVKRDDESGDIDALFRNITFRDFEKLRTTRGDERIAVTDQNWGGGEGEDPAAVDMKVRMILDADNLGKGNSDAFEDSVQILSIFLNHEYNSLGTLESVSLSDGNDFLAADASKIVEIEEYVTNPEEVEQGADPIYGEREVELSPGLFEIKGEEGNDLLIAKNANYIPPQDEIKDDPDTPEDESMPALPERRLEVSGGRGNDWLLTLGGIGADVIGGDGRDFILNTSLGGRIWGDDKEGTDRSESGLEDSDVFWYYPGTFLQDAAPNDILQVFGIPLSGGTNVPVLGGDAFSLLAFLAQFDNFNIVQDFFLPQIFYAFSDTGQLLIYNGFPSGAHPLIDTVDVDPRLGRVMVVEEYERGELTDAFFNRSAPGDLGLTFRIWGG